MACDTCGSPTIRCWECGQPMRQERVGEFGLYWVCRTCMVARLVEPTEAERRESAGWMRLAAVMNRIGEGGGRL